MGLAYSTYDQFPLHEAVKSGNTKTVLRLLQAGCMVNSKNGDEHGLTPLLIAIQMDNYEMAQLLIEHVALVEKTGGEFRKSPLIECIEKNSSISLIELLIQKGASVNAKDSCGNGPLHHAAYCGRIGVIRSLLQHGANPLEKNNSSKTPLDIAREQRCIQCVHILGGVNCDTMHMMQKL